MAKAEKKAIGLQCWNCSYHKFRVVYTRAAPGGKIVRKRECRSCHKYVLTCEQVIGASIRGNIRRSHS